MNEFVGAGVLLALLVAAEGVRRCSDDTVVLQRFAVMRWTLASHARLGRGVCLTSLCIPVLLPVLLPANAGAGSGALGLRRTLARAKARARRTRGWMALLRVNGLAIVATLVVGLPLAISRWGLWGASAGVVALLSLCMAQAVLEYGGLRRGGVARRATLAATRSLWPFSATSAPERVQAQVVAHVPALAAMDWLLGHEAFLEAVRPLAYDALESRYDRDSLFDVVDRQAIASFVRTPPRGNDGEPFCPRCGVAYRDDVVECADCAHVTLLRAHEGRQLPVAPA